MIIIVNTMRQIKLFIFVLYYCTLYCTNARTFNTPSICLQRPPRSESVCTFEIEGFYYDPIKNNCEKYIVGGCHLISGQSFGSQQDCLATCIHGTRRIQDIGYE